MLNVRNGVVFLPVDMAVIFIEAGAVTAAM